ncbi:hypothetical protein EXIGLDRAFT_829153 [Exidia glandulosa HHB12029]|uniref:Transmembrane protein n=1 Tax=Exidia glandulosa HHB12029 TaxID=1314781 RepID=A0A165PSY1_EXIGL|nr:hypothetical protein EXIGLDRAFT_829153 [Exidia glandulosa HHB12029]
MGMHTDIATIFPSAGLRILSNIIHYLGVSICAYCFARRSSMDKLWTWHGCTALSFAKFCILAVFLDSWVFLTLTGILISGVGLSENFVACDLAIYSCIFAYGVSKIFVYFFLIEKVHIVWRTGAANVSRLKSPVYRFCLAVMIPYIGVFVIMIVGKVAFQRDDGICVIGLRPYASLPLISYDLFINVFLTGMFLWPIFHSRFSNPRLKAVARRTLIAAVTGLTTSCVNMGILTIKHGEELGWVCLASCGTDVVVNAVVIYWVTGGSSQSNAPTVMTLEKNISVFGGTAARRGSGPQAPSAAYIPPNGKSTRRDSLPDSEVDRSSTMKRKYRPGLLGTMSRILSSENTRTRMDEENEIAVHVTVVQETHMERPESYDDDLTLPRTSVMFETDSLKREEDFF